MYYIYRQNNSGGYCDINKDVSEYVVIEAINMRFANLLFRRLTKNQSPSCYCCGPRWGGLYESVPKKTEILKYCQELANKGFENDLPFTVVLHLSNGDKKYFAKGTICFT